MIVAAESHGTVDRVRVLDLDSASPKCFDRSQNPNGVLFEWPRVAAGKSVAPAVTLG